jgi:hypothetical protein
MMRGFISVVACLAAARLCGSAQSPDAGHPAPEPRAMRVLFIGNSLTYFNNLPRLVAALADSAHQPPMSTRMIVGPGFTLRRHWEDGFTAAALREPSWDYVVLQEQGAFGLPAEMVNGLTRFRPTVFFDYARRFDRAIREGGAKTVFFQSWAARDLPDDQDTINGIYTSIANELGARVAPVGMAWRESLRKRRSLHLYQADGSHPSPAGSYLAACVFYATLYGQSPEGLTGRIAADSAGIPGTIRITRQPQGQVPLDGVNLSERDARFLQEVAWRTVRGVPAKRSD